MHTAPPIGSSHTSTGRATPYVPTPTRLKRESGRFHIITGPNMGGKSTYIRQVHAHTHATQHTACPHHSPSLPAAWDARSHGSDGRLCASHRSHVCAALAVEARQPFVFASHTVLLHVTSGSPSWMPCWPVWVPEICKCGASPLSWPKCWRHQAS